MKLASLLLLTFVIAAPAFADGGSCEDGWNDTETFELDGSDLALHSKAPNGWDAYGHAGCLFWDDSSLEPFQNKVVAAFQKRVQKNFVKYLKQGKPANTDIVCRFDQTNLKPVASFDEIDGNTPLDKALAKKDCGPNIKMSHFAYVKIPFTDANVKMRCGPSDLMKRWEDACAPRAPASVKAKPKK